MLEPLLRARLGAAAGTGPAPVRLVPVANRFFGGNIAVTGLLTGADLARVLEAEPPGHRYLLPDVCLSDGRFLDGTTPADLPRPVEVVPTDGLSLRLALDAGPAIASGPAPAPTAAPARVPVALRSAP